MDTYNKIHDLMIRAIEEKRPNEIEEFCLPIWNQPFFYKLDKARVLTISYSPTDRGAKTNYPSLVEEHKVNPLSSEKIFEVLYDFIPEPHFRGNYNKIFSELNVNPSEIAHMDISSFPFNKDGTRQKLRNIDKSYKYTLEAIDLLSDQLEYILIDGKDNKEIIEKHFSKDYILHNETSMAINKSNRPYKLSIYKHKIKNTTLIYYGCFLWGNTRPNKEYLQKIVEYIKKSVN
jgi:hypothetical protein